MNYNQSARCLCKTSIRDEQLMAGYVTYEAGVV